MKKIERIEVVCIPDSDPDLSWLGEYSNTPGKGAIDRKERGDMGRNELRYFNPRDTKKPEYGEQDYAQMEAYSQGVWSCIGVRAVAHLLIGPDNRSTSQTISSLGVLGVQSDGDFAEIAHDELLTLKGLLLELGFAEAEIEAAQPKELIPS